MASMRHIDIIAGSKRHALWVGAIVIGAVALYGRLVSPQVGHLHAMQQFEPVVEVMAEENERIRVNLDEKRQRLRQMQRQLDAASEGLFPSGESRSLLHDLHSLVEQAGGSLVMADLTADDDVKQAPESVDDPQTVKILHVVLIVQGRYEQIQAIFQRLREGPRMIWVESCQLDLFDPAGERFECQLALTLCTSLDREGGTNPQSSFADVAPIRP